MASLICKVCPNVRLYIYKLNEYIDPQSGKRQITAESAAKVSQESAPPPPSSSHQTPFLPPRAFPWRRLI